MRHGKIYYLMPVIFIKIIERNGKIHDLMPVIS